MHDNSVYNLNTHIYTHTTDSQHKPSVYYTHPHPHLYGLQNDVPPPPWLSSWRFMIPAFVCQGLFRPDPSFRKVWLNICYTPYTHPLIPHTLPHPTPPQPFTHTHTHTPTHLPFRTHPHLFQLSCIFSHTISTSLECWRWMLIVIYFTQNSYFS